MKTHKPCKGQHKAHGFEGCGKETKQEERKYGLCRVCYWDWMQSTEGGKVHYQKQFLPKVAKKKKQKEREAKREVDTSAAMRLADMYFSRCVRLFYADLEGNCTCYTCGKITNLKECDNGHYQKREHKGTRYHLNNCRPQCKTCNGNTKHNGKQDVFRKNLIYEIGEEAVLEVERLAREVKKVNTKWFRDIADEYRIKLNELQNKLKVKYW